MAALEQLEQKLTDVWQYLTPEERAQVDELLVDNCRDPLARLFDPDFRVTSWRYEHSKIDTPLPGKLHAKQLEALEACATHKHTFLFWGNQVGKTTLGAINTVLVALGRHPYLKKWDAPVVCWASALSWELWENILLPELLTWIPPDRLISAPPPGKKSTNRHILLRADNGTISRITGKAAEQGADKYQSARVHWVWCDEEHPEAVWDEMQPRLLRHGGHTFTTATPLKGLTWVYHRIYEPWQKKERPEVFCSHAGLVDNPSITREEIAQLSRELANNPPMLAARLFGKFVRPQGLVLKPIPPRVMPGDKKARLEAKRALVRRGAVTAGVDFGLHRFAFLVGAADPSGELVLLDEHFSQGESLEARATVVTEKLELLGVSPHALRFVGDCANPTDILELNLAFERIKSPYRVGAVDGEHKIIKAGIARILVMIGAGELSRAPDLGDGQLWHEGKTAEKPGRPVSGSRFLWELEHWSWPKTTENKPAQRDVPNDDSADGADMMAALRYLVMAHYFGKGTPDPSTRTEDQHRRENSRPHVGLPRELRRDATDTPRGEILTEPRSSGGWRDALPRYGVPHSHGDTDPDDE